MSRAESVRGDPSKHGSTYRQYQKRQQARRCRREGRQMLDEAPPRNRYRGWSL
jgi:hypothetical protein